MRAIFNQSIVQLYKTCKIFGKRFWLHYWFSYRSKYKYFKIQAIKWQQLYQIVKRIKPSKKTLINIQNVNDNESFKYCFLKYLYVADHHPAKIRKVDRLFADELDFGYIKFTVKFRDICKIEKNAAVTISVAGYQNKEKYPIYVSKNALKINQLIYY